MAEKGRLDSYEFKRLGQDRTPMKKYFMLDDESMRKRALESIYGTGKNPRKVDRKRVPLVHQEILRVCGYIVDMPNLGVLILTEKAKEDWDQICSIET